MHNSWSALFEVREALAAYVEALWAGRSGAPSTLRPVYTERLAVAARLSALLRCEVVPQGVASLIRQEDRAFPRDLLATEAGRQARSAFARLTQAIAALEGHAPRDGALPTGPETMVGDPLSSVGFRAESLTLDFDGQLLQVACPVAVVVAAEGTVSAGGRGFCDALVACVGATVESVSMVSYAAVVAFAGRQIVLTFQEPIAPPLDPLVFVNRDGVTRRLPLVEA